jgi:hypothetical protein
MFFAAPASARPRLCHFRLYIRPCAHRSQPEESQMKKLLALCVILVTAFVVSATAPAAHAATDVTGDWTAQMQGPNGDMTLRQCK